MLEEFDELVARLTRRLLAPGEGETDDRLVLIDALARVFEAQQSGAPSACVAPLLPGATLVSGARVPGTSLELEPSQAAWCVGWLAGDACVGALLPLADYLARRAVLTGVRPLRLTALLQACGQARAIAASLALPAPFDAARFARPLTLRVAIAGVAARLLGASDGEVAAALGFAFADGLAPQEEGPRTAALTAAAAVRHALLARAGAPAAPRVLGGPDGLEARLLGGAVTLREASPAPPAAAAPDPLLAWHRFELAVRGRFNERQANRLLATVHADAPLETMPLQTFVALLVRPS